MNDLSPVESSRYLLFARPGDGTTDEKVRDDLLADFTCEDEARRAFRQVRLSTAYRDGWAELVSVGGSRVPQRMCWFGDRSPSTSTSPRNRRARPKGATVQTTKEATRVAAQPQPLAVSGRRRRAPLATALLGAVLTATAAVVGVLVDDGGRSQAPSTNEQPLIPFVQNGTPWPGPEVSSVDG